VGEGYGLWVMGNYKELEIYQLSFDLAIKVHHLTMTLPKHELYEQASQLRRSAQSIKDNIAEGYGRRRYKLEYIRFLIFAHASCDEAISQLEMINILYFKDDPKDDMIRDFNTLGSKINRFIQHVEKNWNPSP
jgi:four helix bundle protein